MSALHRAQNRRTSAGFTLIELMVVVVLISILAVMAMPKMSGARDDRMAFDYARQIAGMMHRARTRAIGRGAAHIVAIQPGGGGAGGLGGRVLMFEVLDGVPGPTPPGPNPLSSCRTLLSPTVATTNKSPIDDIVAWVGAPGSTGSNARFVESVDLNVPGIPTTAGIGSTVKLAGVVAQAWTLYCVNPYGSTYVATDTAIPAAATTLVGSLPFTDVLEITVQRGWATPTGPIGLARRIVVASDAAPRIQSQ